MRLPALTGRIASVALHRYRQHARGLTLGARAVIMTEAEHGPPRVLLVRHTYTPGYQLPGGGVEPGESALTALHRELWEEAHITLDAPPRLLGFYHNAPDWPRDHLAVYVSRHWTQPEPPKPDAEIAEHLWAPIDALPAAIKPSAAARIAEALGEAEPDGLWVPKSA